MEMSPILNFIGTIFVGFLSFIGVVISNNNSNKKIEQQLITSQAVTDTKIENLTLEVQKHNNFASKIPVMETKIDNLKTEVDTLKEDVRNLRDM